MQEFSDIQLLEKIRNHDEAAFAELYNRHWQACYLTACKILNLPDLAEDIVQEVFFKIWERREEQQIESIKAYLQQATRNKVLNAIRAQKTDLRFYSRLAAVSTDLLEENHVLLRENEQLLAKLITMLPADCQETFRLSRIEHLTYKEIATLLQVSEKTVEKRISKSLRFLRTHYYVILILLLPHLPSLSQQRI